MCAVEMMLLRPLAAGRDAIGKAAAGEGLETFEGRLPVPKKSGTSRKLAHASWSTLMISLDFLLSKTTCKQLVSIVKRAPLLSLEIRLMLESSIPSLQASDILPQKIHLRPECVSTTRSSGICLDDMEHVLLWMTIKPRSQVSPSILVLAGAISRAVSCFDGQNSEFHKSFWMSFVDTNIEQIPGGT